MPQQLFPLLYLSETFEYNPENKKENPLFKIQLFDFKI